MLYSIFCHKQELILEIVNNSVYTTVELFPSSKSMTTLRNKRKLTAVSRETLEIARNSQFRNTFFLGMTEEYITQFSEKIEGKVTKKLSQEFSRTKSAFLDALSKLDEFLLNPEVRTFSGTVPGTSRDKNLRNREPTGNRSQNDPNPEVEFSTRRTSNSTYSDQEETSHGFSMYFLGSRVSL